jgi:hypothetical protein
LTRFISLTNHFKPDCSFARLKTCFIRYSLANVCGVSATPTLSANWLNDGVVWLLREAAGCRLLSADLAAEPHALCALSPRPPPGAPHLARFSRDVGYHRTPPQAFYGSHRSTRAAGIRRVKGAKRLGVPLGNWLFAELAAFAASETTPHSPSCWAAPCGEPRQGTTAGK